MKKGDIKKQEILQTAEQLFCRKGFKETSIQDILDVLHSSKGSFYHHYASKESVLAALCVQRANAMAAAAEESLKQETDTIRRMNVVFSGMMPLNGERLSFLLMLLPVLGLPEGWSVKNAYRDSLEKAFLKLLTQVISDGCADGTLYCSEISETAAICLKLANEVWCMICESILSSERKAVQTDAGNLLSAISSYRTALERILSAPYGSIRLLDLAEIIFL